MSQTKSKVHKLTIRNRPGSEDRITTGANTQVLLDGVPLKACKFIKFEIKAAAVSKVYIELYAEVDIEANVLVEQSELKETDLKIDGKPVAIYTLSNPAPVALATKIKKD